MDGRVQKAVAEYGQKVFGAEFPDTVTEAGLDGILSKPLDENFRKGYLSKLLISLDKHGSRGIVFHGHEDCAGNPVDEDQHKEDIKKSIETLHELLKGKDIQIKGVYVKVHPFIEVVEVV